MFFLLNTAVASEPKPWQMDLQEPAGIIATKATDLHNFLLVVITLISVFVLGLLVYVCIKFREKPNVTPSKTSHNTLIEIIWTVVPVLILVVIAVPSAVKLACMDVVVFVLLYFWRGPGVEQQLFAVENQRPLAALEFPPPDGVRA